MRHNGCECKIAMLESDFNELLKQFKEGKSNCKLSTFFPIYHITKDKERIAVLCGNYLLDNSLHNPALDYIVDFLVKKNVYYEFAIINGEVFRSGSNKTKNPVLSLEMQLELLRDNTDLFFIPDTI